MHFLYFSFDIPVLESLSRIDWTMRDGPHPIHPRRMPLNHTVPVNGQSFHQQIILDIHYNLSIKYIKTYSINILILNDFKNTFAYTRYQHS